jgi:hypothetical protein
MPFKFGFYKKYFLLTALLFLIEVLIAVFVHDRFIRPYFGDYLVVIFLYCFLRSFVRAPVLPAALAVLVFSYLIEVLQYYNLVSMLGLEQSKIARIVIGTGFSWWDMVAYTLGIATVILMERRK